MDDAYQDESKALLDEAKNIVERMLDPTSRNAKLLIATVEHAPTLEGQRTAAQLICQHKDQPAELNTLAQSFLDNPLTPVMAQGGKTPWSSDTPFIGENSSCTESDQAVRQLKQLREKVLKRDGYRCLIFPTRCDPDIADSGFEYDPYRDTVHLVIATHIIPFALSSSSQGIEGAVWRNLESFTGGELLKLLSGSGINAVNNVMSLSDLARIYFGKLTLALEEIESDPGNYNVLLFDKQLQRFGIRDMPKTVRFPQHTPDPKPDPFYLKIHCALAKVLHASGAAEELDEIIRDTKDISVLARDGNSAKVLAVALNNHLLLEAQG